MTESAGLWDALLDAQRQAQAITKTGLNKAQGWEFHTVEQVTRVAREALNGAGLVAVLRLTDDTAEDKTIGAVLAVMHPASGQEERFPVPWPVERPGPQARRAAYAYARKQALMELLALSEPDPETDAKPQEKPRPAARSTVRIAAETSGDLTGNERKSDEKPAENPAGNPPGTGLVTPAQLRKINAQLGDLQQSTGHRLDRDERRALIATLAGAEWLDSAKDLTRDQAHTAIEALDRVIADTPPQPPPES